MNLNEAYKNVKTRQEWEALRGEIKEVLQREEYGYFPEPPLSVEGKVTEEQRTMAGKAVLQTVMLTLRYADREFSFPFKLCYRPGCKNKTVLLLNFRSDFPDKYLPAEEVIDKGWAVADLYYQDVTADNGDFTSGLAALFPRDEGSSCGKIVLWAYAAMRVADYLATREEIDMQNLAVAGHSRLGKTALVTAAFDERFAYCHSNCSGTSGAALFCMRNEKSESIAAITKNFPFWFAEKFKRYIDCEGELPFDQHLLLALVAPRRLSVGSAVEDLWANPPAEYEALRLASKVFPLYGKRETEQTESFACGKIYGTDATYYVREGTHYLSRADWNLFLDAFDCKF